MASDGTTVERLRQFLRELKPEARSLLTAELERAVLRGEGVPGGELILQELRQIIRESRGSTPRLGAAMRLFYQPVEPFMVDDFADHNHPNRIARTALTPIWNWISRDLLPAEAEAFANDAGDALLASDTERARTLAQGFQDQVAAAIQAAFAAVRGDEKAGRRLRSQIGTPLSEENTATIARAFAARAQFEQFMQGLPLQIDDLAGERLDDVKSRIDAEAARDQGNFPYLLLMVMSRLGSPWQLIRLAIKAAASDHASRVASTSYALAVNIILAELARMVGELKSELRSGRGVACGVLLKHIHDAARGLRTELDLPNESNWGRQLTTLRAQMADLLKSEIDSMPGRVRRLLRPRQIGEIRPGAVLDPDDVMETELLVEFVGACRNFASELAINEMTQRAYNELQQYLDGSTRNLVESLRHAGDGERPFRQSQVDAAIRFCGKVFGAEYAAMITRSAESAAQDERARVKA